MCSIGKIFDYKMKLDFVSPSKSPTEKLSSKIWENLEENSL